MGWWRIVFLVGLRIWGCAGSQGQRMSRIFGIFPGEAHLQDFWGPVGLAFDATLDFEAHYKTANQEEVEAALSEILEAVGDHPESALVVGPMRYGEASYAS